VLARRLISTLDRPSLVHSHDYLSPVTPRAPKPRAVSASEQPKIDIGGSEASGWRSYQRPRPDGREPVPRKHPHIGGVMLGLINDSARETAPARGAAGEQLVAQALTEHCPDVIVLHGRSVRRFRASIEHIAVAATGVWVIDRHKGKLEISKSLVGQPTLRIDGCDHAKLVAGLVKQVDIVNAAVADMGLGVPVHGCFCFVESQLPMIGTPSIKGFRVFGHEDLADRLSATGALNAAGATHLAAALDKRFPAA
jgi:hypothetical protein